jgi:hypothetical protein
MLSVLTARHIFFDASSRMNFYYPLPKERANNAKVPKVLGTFQ